MHGLQWDYILFPGHHTGIGFSNLTWIGYTQGLVPWIRGGGPHSKFTPSPPEGMYFVTWPSASLKQEIQVPIAHITDIRV